MMKKGIILIFCILFFAVLAHANDLEITQTRLTREQKLEQRNKLKNDENLQNKTQKREAKLLEKQKKLEQFQTNIKERIKKLDKLILELSKIIELADKIGYDSAKLKSYQTNLLKSKEIYLSFEKVAFSSEFDKEKFKIHNQQTKLLIDGTKEEFVNIKKFLIKNFKLK